MEDTRIFDPRFGQAKVMSYPRGNTFSSLVTGTLVITGELMNQDDRSAVDRIFTRYPSDCLGMWVLGESKKTYREFEQILALPSRVKGGYYQRFAHTSESVSNAVDCLARFGRHGYWWLGSFAEGSVPAIDVISEDDSFVLLESMWGNLARFHLLMLLNLDRNELEIFFNGRDQFDDFISFVSGELGDSR